MSGGRPDRQLCQGSSGATPPVAHASQQLIEHAPGEIEITLQLNNLIDVEHAILRWGPQAGVLSPPALRTRVRDAQRYA